MSRDFGLWSIIGTVQLHGHHDGLESRVIKADAGNPDCEREVALVDAWDREGERITRLITAAPRLLAACLAVVEGRERGDLADAARVCCEAAELVSD